jgi:hypothetical protein
LAIFICEVAGQAPADEPPVEERAHAAAPKRLERVFAVGEAPGPHARVIARVLDVGRHDDAQARAAHRAEEALRRCADLEQLVEEQHAARPLGCEPQGPPNRALSVRAPGRVRIGALQRLRDVLEPFGPGRQPAGQTPPFDPPFQLRQDRRLADPDRAVDEDGLSLEGERLERGDDLRSTQ